MRSAITLLGPYLWVYVLAPIDTDVQTPRMSRDVAAPSLPSHAITSLSTIVREVPSLILPVETPIPCPNRQSPLILPFNVSSVRR